MPRLVIHLADAFLPQLIEFTKGISVGESDGELSLYHVLASLAAITTKGIVCTVRLLNAIITTIPSFHHQEFPCRDRKSGLPRFCTPTDLTLPPDSTQYSIGTQLSTISHQKCTNFHARPSTAREI